jgi:hypothetical protein
MKTNGTIIGEGKINNIPKSTNISMRLLPLNYTSSKYKNILHKYYVSRNENNSIMQIKQKHFSVSPSDHSLAS